MRLAGVEASLLKTGTLWLAGAVELAAALIIALAVMEAVFRIAAAFRRELHPSGGAHPALDKKEEIRFRLGRWLVVALEFLLAADILKTAVAPSWSEIGQLAAIAVLRTALNFFLQREIDNARLARSDDPPFDHNR